MCSVYSQEVLYAQGMLHMMKHELCQVAGYVQASVEVGSEDVSLLERFPRFRGWYL